MNTWQRIRFVVLCLVCGILVGGVGGVIYYSSRPQPSPVPASEGPRDVGQQQEKPPHTPEKSALAGAGDGALPFIPPEVPLHRHIRTDLEACDYSNATSEARVKELGTRTHPRDPQADDLAMIFFYGHYIDSPYIVSRKGAAILINDIPIMALRRFPELYEEGEPPPLPHVDRNTCLSQIKFGKTRWWWTAKLQWKMWHLPSERAFAEFSAEMKTLPCVKEVRIRPDGKPRTDPEDFIDGNTYDHITVTCHREKCDCEIYLPQVDFRIKSREEFLEKMEHALAAYAHDARIATCIFSGPGSFGTWDERDQKCTPYFFLPEIVGILKSNLPEEEKLRQVFPYFKNGKPFTPYTDKFGAIQMFVKTFRGSAQLDRKLERVLDKRKRLGITRPEDIWTPHFKPRETVTP